MTKSMTPEDWAAMAAEVYSSFSPGSPIKLQSDLAGREEQAGRLRGIILSSGEHALIYGERGAGKTSIANTFHLNLNNETRRIHPIHINCGDNDFTAIWRKVFRRIKVESDAERRSLDAFYPANITPDDVEIELSNFKINDVPIIILDEFDQISDQKTKSLITETIKSFSDHTIHAKIVLVGIASNAAELIAQHASISRALKQVHMPRLSLSELEAIVSTRYKRCGLRSDDEALFQMAFLSRGLPYYAHLIGRHSALSAIERKQNIIRVEDVFSGLQEAIKEVDQTITEDYLAAVVSQRNEETLFEPVLTACALAESDDLGQFQQAAVAAPLAEIAARTPAYTPATFAFHMNEFCEAKRGKVLSRSGEIRNYRYSFSDAMMQPYVIIRALQSGRLKRDTFQKFITRRQRALAV
jgi:Cdc6-like AAA superfamily ATPase